MRRRGVIRVAVVGLLALVASLAVVSYVGPREILMTVVTITWPRRFSQEQWSEHPDERYLMALDIDQSGRLRGRTEQQVRQLLGPPSQEYGLPDEADHELEWVVAYPSGPHDGLLVTFHDGTVEAWDLSTDPLMTPQHR